MKKLLDRKCSWQDNIKKNLTVLRRWNIDWIKLAQNAVMKLGS
jgi:hypothetical protein